MDVYLYTILNLGGKLHITIAFTITNSPQSIRKVMLQQSVSRNIFKTFTQYKLIIQVNKYDLTEDCYFNSLFIKLDKKYFFFLVTKVYFNENINR